MPLHPCPGPISRREFLRIGGLAVGGLTLDRVLAARAASDAAPDTSVILIYCSGGASHLETYDLKPDAPVEYRSVFKPISTNVPGVSICELFPLQAKLADRFTLIRSLNHEINIHSDGGIEVTTGKTPSRIDPTSQSRSEHPDFGKVHGPHPRALPRYVAVPQPLYFTLPTYIGVEHKPFVVGDPANENYRPPQLRLPVGVNGQRLDDRRGLLREFDQLRRDLDQRGELEAIDRFRAQAYHMLASTATAQACDLSQEDPRLRDRYGRHRWGQACLLARRLAEAGVSVVSVVFNTPKEGPEFTNWDDHPGNATREGHFAKFMTVRLPYYDQSLAALIEDIAERRLDRRILVVVFGEFGRTPRLRTGPPNQSIGRDHWPQAYSALVAGGGFRMGQVIGATNSRGEHPTQRPLSPRDLLATIYQHLGVDYRQSFFDYSKRPVPILADGEPIRELVG
jgi:hypothetical protein